MISTLANFNPTNRCFTLGHEPDGLNRSGRYWASTPKYASVDAEEIGRRLKNNIIGNINHNKGMQLCHYGGNVNENLEQSKANENTKKVEAIFKQLRTSARKLANPIQREQAIDALRNHKEEALQAIVQFGRRSERRTIEIVNVLKNKKIHNPKEKQLLKLIKFRERLKNELSKRRTALLENTLNDTEYLIRLIYESEDPTNQLKKELYAALKIANPGLNHHDRTAFMNYTNVEEINHFTTNNIHNGFAEAKNIPLSVARLIECFDIVDQTQKAQQGADTNRNGITRASLALKDNICDFVAEAKTDTKAAIIYTVFSILMGTGFCYWSQEGPLKKLLLGATVLMGDTAARQIGLYGALSHYGKLCIQKPWELTSYVISKFTEDAIVKSDWWDAGRLASLILASSYLILK